MISLEGKTAVVTGAGRGIGAAIAETLAAAGCSLVVSDIDLAAADAVVAEIRSAGGKASAFKTDVSQPAEAEALINSVITEYGRLDILVNNAGITRDNLIMRMSEEEWDVVLRVNLKGVFNCLKAASRPMLKQRSGKIINIASVVGVMGNAGQANYSASKGGVIALTKSAAKEFGSRNIQVNAVAPGYIETDMTRSLPESIRQGFLTLIPLQRAGQPKDVADVVLFLASPLSNYITGQVLHVDGGMAM